MRCGMPFSLLFRVEVVLVFYKGLSVRDGFKKDAFMCTHLLFPWREIWMKAIVIWNILPGEAGWTGNLPSGVYEWVEQRRGVVQV